MEEHRDTTQCKCWLCKFNNWNKNGWGARDAVFKCVFDDEGGSLPDDELKEVLAEVMSISSWPEAKRMVDEVSRNTLRGKGVLRKSSTSPVIVKEDSASLGARLAISELGELDMGWVDRGLPEELGALHLDRVVDSSDWVVLENLLGDVHAMAFAYVISVRMLAITRLAYVKLQDRYNAHVEDLVNEAKKFKDKQEQQLQEEQQQQQQQESPRTHYAQMKRNMQLRRQIDCQRREIAALRAQLGQQEDHPDAPFFEERKPESCSRCKDRVTMTQDHARQLVERSERAEEIIRSHRVASHLLVGNKIQDFTKPALLADMIDACQRMTFAHLGRDFQFLKDMPDDQLDSSIACVAYCFQRLTLEKNNRMQKSRGEDKGKEKDDH